MPPSVSTKTAGVGADVESLCSKCGDVWHVVVAKVGEKIVKVECKECRRQHRHKSPDGTPTASARTPKAPVREKAARAKAMPAIDPSQPLRPYRPSDTYLAGEYVKHPTFGAGVILGIPGPGKMEVAFPSGTRILIQAKAASRLEPPPLRHIEGELAETDDEGRKRLR